MITITLRIGLVKSNLDLLQMNDILDRKDILRYPTPQVEPSGGINSDGKVGSFVAPNLVAILFLYFSQLHSTSHSDLLLLGTGVIVLSVIWILTNMGSR